MNPQRAYDLGIRPSVCSIRSISGFRDGHWVVYAYDRPVTQSADLFSMCRWLRRLEALDTPQDR
jgi:hypothetical protein